MFLLRRSRLRMITRTFTVSLQERKPEQEEQRVGFFSLVRSADRRTSLTVTREAGRFRLGSGYVQVTFWLAEYSFHLSYISDCYFDYPNALRSR